MRLTSLRVVGFKTFVEATDIPIGSGLTGVVGPNGCGKSNLVEALRWVMGESSHKNMRASAMDDVIFGGSTSRPARNRAEVMLAIDNSDRLAPAAFNDADLLEVVRRIERSEGSSYHVNGREVRARDVQLLFADAATGARSPALVRQGQIGEIIAAKPQARRRILEDAAGIAGLHARRQEAELRLAHAEENLVRVDDILREIETQVEGLRRQERQAVRYRALSAEIRKGESQLAAHSFRSAQSERDGAEAAEREAVRAVAESTLAQGAAARNAAVAEHEAESLRQADAAAAATLQRLQQARTELDGEERRARVRLAELDRRIAEAERDAARQAQAGADAADAVARLKREEVELERVAGFAAVRRAALRGEVTAAEAALAAAEASLSVAQAELAERAARRAALARDLAAGRDRAERAGREAARLRAELAAARASQAQADLTTFRDAFASAEAAAKHADDAAARARLELARAREADATERAAFSEADRDAQRRETELRTLAKLFASGGEHRYPTMLDALTVTAGHELAVAAALGDDLDASVHPEAPLRWRDTGVGEGDPALPDGALPLIEVASGPASMTRRLHQIGLVSRADAARLVPLLGIGQRLVSREGDLWRWDGLTADAEAPSPAARRLAEKNRMAELGAAAAEARARAESRRAVAAAAESSAKAAAATEGSALDGARKVRRALDDAREALARAERRSSEGATRLSTLAEAAARVDAGESEARDQALAAERDLAGLGDAAEAEARLNGARSTAGAARGRVAELRAALGTVAREEEAAKARGTALATDFRLWAGRAERSAAMADELSDRLAVAKAERDDLAAAPDAFLRKRHGLVAEIEGAERRRRGLGDGLAVAERTFAERARAARAALDHLAAARERRAATEARSEAAGRRLAEVTRAVLDSHGVGPAELLALAGSGGARDVDPAALEARLVGLKADRERLGGVNLRAEDELAETEGKRERLAEERGELVEAIKRLRQAVSGLNREGRERLAAAFEAVDAHFRRLFTTLFGGGEAELTLVDSADPLEAGLEIIARPPGKRPQSLSLLSGGEQALTAIALIFAVFLTNPSPICVLDEVDAPLDDANVERYCDLLDGMAADTDTRFLVITHHPITMARMDRLLGITMAERGISQLVSVDLETAERLRDAG